MEESCDAELPLLEKSCDAELPLLEKESAGDVLHDALFTQRGLYRVRCPQIDASLLTVLDYACHALRLRRPLELVSENLRLREKPPPLSESTAARLRCATATLLSFLSSRKEEDLPKNLVSDFDEKEKELFVTYWETKLGKTLRRTGDDVLLAITEAFGERCPPRLDFDVPFFWGPERRVRLDLSFRDPQKFERMKMEFARPPKSQ